jgi:hypothetical protein
MSPRGTSSFSEVSLPLYYDNRPSFMSTQMNSPRLDLSKEPPVLGVGTMKILFAGFVGGAMGICWL